MREITLKELAAYLPYGLKIQLGDGEIKEVIGIRDWIGWCITYKSKYGETNMGFKAAKPILRPITEVENDIIHNGKTVNVLDIMNTFWGVEWLGATEQFEIPEVYGRNIILSAEDLPYDLVQVLLEHHFDVFGLIPDNLAIPVTNEFNPYK